MYYIFPVQIVVLDGNFALGCEPGADYPPKCTYFIDARTNSAIPNKALAPVTLPHCTDRGLGSCIVLCAVPMSGAYRFPHAPSQTLASMILICISDLVLLFLSARYAGFGFTAKVRETFLCHLLVSSTALCRFLDLFLLFFLWK